MGQELIRSIQKLQGLQESPQPYHWFCPRKGTEDAEVFYEEDLRANKDVDLSDAAAQARKKPIEDAKARQSLALNVMEIFAYSGDDAISYQNWIRTQLRDTVTQCDICSREYHRGRQELAQKLRERYDDTDVETFMQKFDSVNLDRIQDGLTRAAQTLRRLPQEQRNLTSLTTLDTLGLYALFEALNCVPALVDQDFLRQHFDEAFALAQTKRRMKVQIYTPAMTYFLFQDQSDRNSWASTSWDLFKRPGNSLPTAAEFEYAVREPLTKAMSRVQLQDLDRKFVPRFWSGARSIVYRLDKDLITHSLRALDYDICKLALDHLQIDCDGFPDLLQAITRILTVSPNDFWEAMGATPASVWVEQFFNSKALDRFITRATKQAVFNNQLLEDLYAWMEPFLASIKPVNQPAVCRGILSQLLGTLQHANYPQKYKSFCFTKGIIILDAILCGASNERAVAGARTAGLEALDLLESHLDAILASTSTGHEFAEVSSEVIRRALTLDCKYVLADRTALLLGRPPQPGFCKYRSNIWTRSVASLGTDNMILGNRLLLATSTLTGAEAFVSKGNSGPSNDLQQFNATFDALNRCASSILERIGEFDPEHIQDLFSEKETVDGLFAHLFSSNPDVRSALLEILKAVSGMTVRSEAIFEAIKSYLPEVLGAFTTSLQRIASWETFAAVSTLWIGCKDLLEALCSPTDGILRSRKLTSKDGDALEQFWSALWRELTIVFGTTEAWSNQGHGKTQLMDFCRSAMDFADYTFDQFAIMTGALGDGVETNVATHNAGKRLVAEPKAAMDVIGKWLRLRDPFLLEKSTELICKLLKRLRQYDTAISESASSYIKDVYTGIVKNNLTQTQKAELRRAWERHTGRSMQPEQDQKQHSAKTPQVIDLDSWRANAQAAASKPMVRGQQRLEQVIASSTRGLDAFKAQQAQKQSRALPTGLSKAPPRTTDAADFMKKREAEKAALKRQKQEAIALAKRRANASHTVDEGSGLAGLGVYDVDHSAPKGEGVMVSSSEDSEESDDDVDSELFGASRKAKAKHLDPEAQANAEALRQARLRQKPQAPVKKLRISRNAKDMRARLAPDLSPLHQSILSWDYFHDGPFPQNSSASDYASVLAAFRDPIEYQRTFQPLLLLEAWSSFLKAKEEVTARAFDLKVLNRSSVDAFIELSTSMGHPDGREIFEGDIVLLSKAQTPTASPDSPNAIARVHRMSRKKAHIEVLFRLLPKTSKTSLSSTLAPNSALRAIKITSITPLEREYGALLGLQYYDLCDEITKAKPSPLLNYTDESLQRYISTFRVNKAQAKAIRSAMDNDAFTLVQGPPGTGKTKTIVAIVGAVLSENLRNGGAAPIATRQPVQGGQASISTSKKLLVCAPSNAAVDELVLRFKQGVTTLTGEHKPVNVVRLGKSDAISSSVLDVTLDELVNKRLNPTDTQGMRDETQKIMKQHQEISAKLREARALLDAAEAKKASTDQLTPLRKDVEDLKKSKTLLSTRIDSAKDNEGSASRLAEQRKRQVQQEIIGEAHVICATLSGSGHDMFQNLNVEFETVIIDEAAQCVELSALIPLKYGCAKCILVGDPQQLPPTVFSKDAARFKYEQSLFVRMQKNHPEDVHLLDTQYRMHPEISRFPSQAFYDGRLLDGPDMAGLRRQQWHAADLLGPFRFFDVQGQHQSAPKGHSLVNYAEVKVAMQMYKRLTADFRGIDFKGKVGIITPYKSQLRELKDQFRRTFGDSITDAIEFNTTDAFQGRESEIIIFSCVRASPSGGVGFLQDIRRMNVGLTRAKSSLWVLGNSNSLLRGEYWAKLIEHAKSSKRFTDGDIEALFRRQLTINDDIEMGEDQISLQARGEPRKLTQPHPTTQSNVNASAQSSARHDLSLPPPAVKKVKSEPLTEQQTAPVKKEKPEKIAPKREHPEKAALQKVQPVKSASQLKRKRSKDEVMRDTPKGGLESGSESSSSRSSKKQPPAKDSKKHTSSNATQPRDVANGAKSSSSAPKTAALPPHLRKKDVNVFIKKKRF